MVFTTGGAYTYDPNPGFSGSDSFTYTITDIASQTDTATVNITVYPLANVDSATLPANSVNYSGTNLLDNDTGLNLSVTAFTQPNVSGGTVQVNANGSYQYTPKANYSGLDSFNYTITDASTSMTSTTNVNLVILPLAINDVGVTVANAQLNGSTLFANDPTEGTLSSYTQPANGAVIVNSDGSYVYTPNTGYSGIDTFTYTVTDANMQSTSATVTITVRPIGNPDSGTTQANTPFTNTVGLLVNDIGTNLSIHSYEQNSIGGGTIIMSDTQLGIYTYIPSPNFSGTDQFRYVAQDASSLLTESTNVLITVTPSSNSDTSSVIAGRNLFGSSVLINDSGSTLTIYNFTTKSSQQGDVSMNSNGTYTYISPLGFSGLDSFTYRSIDSSGQISAPATVEITVLPFAANFENTTVTDPKTPVSGASLLSGSIGTNLTIQTGTFTTTEGGIVEILSDGTYIYTSAQGFVGVDSFRYFLSDSVSTSLGTVTIQVTIPEPMNFNGITETCKFLNKTTFRLESSWTPPPSFGVSFYKIYNGMDVVATISNTGPFVYSTCLSSKEMATEFFITSVLTNQTESAKIQIVIN